MRGTVDSVRSASWRLKLPSHRTPADDLLEKLVGRVREIVGHSSREHALFRAILKAQSAAADALFHDRFRGRPPEGLIQAYRAPKGTRQVVTLVVQGETVNAVIAGSGADDPAQVEAAWDFIQSRVLRGAA
jgi:hypothetical protein